MSRKNDEKWMEQFEVYKKYVGENLRFPPALAVFEGYKIGQWFRNQVVALRGGFLDENRKALMDGFQPGWEEPRGVRDGSELKMRLVLDWRSGVSKGCMPIDVLFQDEQRLAACLRAKIYDVETFFHMSNHLSEYSDTGVKALVSQEHSQKAFELLFPSLNIGHIRLFQDVFRYDSADGFEKACFFFKQHIPSFSENVEKMLGALTENEGKVLRAFYGMDGRAPQNFNQIALDMGLSRSRPSLIAGKAIRKLRHPSCVKEMLTDYGNNGKVRERFSPESKTLHFFQYDENGNCTYYQRSNEHWGDGSDVFWERNVYDRNNNLTLCESSDGGWEKAEYNSNGDLLFLKKSDGFWETNVYDTNNNRISSQRSDGWWERREYDEENRLTLLEDSNGRVERYGVHHRHDTQLLEMSIDELDLSVRAWHCLVRSNIRTVGVLIGMTREELSSVRNMGKKSLDEIEEKLVLHGLRLAEPDVERINEGGKDACVAVGILDDMIADAQSMRQAGVDRREAFLLGEPGER